MKGKRVLSLALAALMTLSLLVVPAAAVSFTDMTNHWAKDDVEYLATQGVVKGTSATTFAPDQKMTACEALLFCSRATGVDAIDKEAIAEDWEDELKEILPEEMYAWAAQEMAVCLETGIISETELRALSSAGGLVKSITRETLAMYLVRAMQLAPLAQSLTSYPMSFADTTSISASLQPYVYLLNMYGIVKGNELNRFLPQNSLTRAEMATMLRRAIDFMDERGIYAELPGYTDYDWVGGTIAAVSTGSSGVTLLTLTSVVSGTRSISLPADAEIYENNMLSSADALKVGSYARVNLDRKGTAESVRLGGAVTSYTGSVTGVEQDSLTVAVNGASKRLDIDRFTEVQVGKTAGDYTLLDPQAGYTTATCYVDAMGHLDAVQLSGGTRAEEGILVKVENGTGGQRLQVSAFNGETRRYTLPAGAGNVPEANYKMIAALSVMKGQIERADIPKFVAERGMPGFVPTQGHIPSGVPYIGHALEALKAGTIKRAMIIGKGSLFLGRLTNLADGASFIMEGPGAGTEPAQGVSQSDVTEMLLAALSDVAANLQKG